MNSIGPVVLEIVFLYINIATFVHYHFSDI